MMHGSVLRAVGAALVLLVTACTEGSTEAVSGAPAAADGLPAIYVNGAISNATFYYIGREALTPDNVENVRREIGSPAIVVTTPKADDKQAAETIKALPAKAYRYVNFYWVPESETSHDGVPLTPTRTDWAFCQKAAGGESRAVVGRNAGGENWYFLDLNETAVFNAIRARMIHLKTDGWDGVMFDRGLAATQSAKDINENKLFARRSTCTTAPVTPGATMSDAFVRTLRVAKEAGLSVIMNNGRSPFDGTIPMRPNPRDADCRASRWFACHFIGDVWRHADLVLNETPAHPRAVDWIRDFRANQRSERDSAHGHRTIALITTATLGGAPDCSSPRSCHQTRSNVYYQWSRIKLFNLAVAVNTGTGGCPEGGTTSGVCNRYGVYPELASLRFGRPLKAGPAKQACLRTDAQACVWTRTYARGVNVLNRTGTRKTVTIAFGTTRCQVENVRTGSVLANGCVRRVRLTLPPWSGTPLLYSNPPA